MMNDRNSHLPHVRPRAHDKYLRLIDAAQNKGLKQDERVIWIIVIALLHVLGALIYLIVGRPKRNLAPV